MLVVVDWVLKILMFYLAVGVVSFVFLMLIFIYDEIKYNREERKAKRAERKKMKKKKRMKGRFR
jgi:hypothetical protein